MDKPLWKDIARLEARLSAVEKDLVGRTIAYRTAIRDLELRLAAETDRCVKAMREACALRDTAAHNDFKPTECDCDEREAAMREPFESGPTELTSTQGRARAATRRWKR